MPCSKCAVSAEVDGKMQYVAVFLSDMRKLGQSTERIGVLYQCPNCNAFWEERAYQKRSNNLTSEEVRQFYPGVIPAISEPV